MSGDKPTFSGLISRWANDKSSRNFAAVAICEIRARISEAGISDRTLAILLPEKYSVFVYRITPCLQMRKMADR